MHLNASSKPTICYFFKYVSIHLEMRHECVKFIINEPSTQAVQNKEHTQHTRMLNEGTKTRNQKKLKKRENRFTFHFE